LAKTGKKELPPIIALLEALNSHLQELKPARLFNLEEFVGDMEEVANAEADLETATVSP
jgi:hypothetical protein